MIPRVRKISLPHRFDLSGRDHRAWLCRLQRRYWPLTKALANEWAGKGVNVNAIAPGYIATDNTQALQDDEQRYKAILSVYRLDAGAHQKILAALLSF